MAKLTESIRFLRDFAIISHAGMNATLFLTIAK